MTTGMLYCDDEMGTANRESIRKAIQYFRDRFGEEPNICYLNPELVVEKQKEPSTVEYLFTGILEPNQIWLGVKK